MKDTHIRASLRKRLLRAYAQQPDTLIIDELGLCTGQVRADLAVVNGSLTAFEIKSDRDTLARLKTQVDAYSKVFDQATVVAAGCHLERVLDHIPDWWGVQTVQSWGAAGSRFYIVRHPQRNTAVDAFALAQLLWRNEVAEVLVSLDRIKRSSRQPRRALWKLLVDSVSLDDLREIVRTKLRTRPHWRADRSRTSGGAKYQPFATS